MKFFRFHVLRFTFLSKKKLLIVGSLGLCFAFISIFIFLKFGSKAAAGWFDDDYLYRKPITFNGSADTNKALLVEVDTATLISNGKLQSDCRDTRFTDSTGKELRYYVASSYNRGTLANIRHESNNLSEYTTTSTDGGTLSTSSGAALANTSYGMSVNIPNTTTDKYAQKTFSSSTTRHLRYRVYIDPNTITIPTGNTFIWADLDDSGSSLSYLRLGYTSGSYNISGQIREDDTTSTTTSSYTITDAPHYVEVHITKESSISGNDATYELYIDGDLKETLSGLDFYTGFAAIDSLEVGAISSIDTGTNGTFYIDEIAISDTDYQIGPVTEPCNTSSTDYYVLLPTYATSNQVYMYYGNTGASSRSASSLFSQTTYSPSSGPTLGTEENSAGPMAAWKFDEGSGSTAQDATENNNDGTITNAVWKGESECIAGKCLYFDGTGDYVTMGDLYSDALTVCAWVKPNALNSAADNIVVKRNNASNAAATNEFQFILTSTGAVTWTSWNASSVSTLNLTSTQTVPLNNWSHVCAVQGGAGNAGYLYINGKQAANSTQGAAMVDSAAVVQVGTWSASDATRYFQGYIDEVKIYPYARSAAQIAGDTASRSSVHGVAAQFGNPDEGRRLMDGLVGWWKLDEGTGTTSVDASGNNFSLSQNATVAWNGGKYGSSLVTDSGGFYAADNDLFDGTSTITISAWVNRDNAADWQRLVGKYYWSGANNGSWYLRFNDANNVQFILNNGSSFSEITSSSTLSLDTWYHVTATYNGQKMDLYVNGELEASAAVSGAIPNTAYCVTIGFTADTDCTTAQNRLDGQIDDVRIYNRALSPADVRLLYAYAPAPVGYWPIDENQGGDGTTIKDISTYGNNGTLTSPAGTTITSGTPTFQQVVTGTATGAPVSVTSASITGVANHLYLAAIAGKAGGGTVSSVTGIGLTWQPIISDQCASANDTDISLWYAIGTPSGNGAITANFSTGPNQQAAIAVSRYSGVNTSNPIGAYGSSNVHGASSTDCSDLNDQFPTVSITTTNTDSLVYGAISKRQRSFAPDSGITERSDFNSGGGGDAAGLAIADRPGVTAGSYTISGDIGSTTDWAAAAVEINSAVTTTPAGSAWVPGKYGSALRFDGSQGYISRADDADFDFEANQDFTVSAWVKFTDTSLGNYIIEKRTSATGVGYSLFDHGTTGDIHFRIQDSVTEYDCDTNIDLKDGKFHHVAGYRSGSTIGVYIDGINRCTTSATSNTIANTGSLLIGKRSNNDDYFKGTIDEVRIFNYARTPGQIVSDMNGGHPLGGSPVGSSALYYRFDEGFGTTINNAGHLGIGTTGALGTGTSAPTWTDAGKFGRALLFDGTNDYILVNDTPGLDIIGDMSISAWLKPSNIATDMWYANKDNATSQRSFSCYLRLGYPRCLVFKSDSTYTQVTSQTPVNANEWSHVLFTYNTTTDTAAIYVNGLKMNITYDARTAGAIQATTANLWIGGRNFDTNFFKGTIDEVKIYSAALNAEQALVDYNRGKSIVLGSSSTASDGKTADNSAARKYCLPGDTTTCNAPVGEWLLDENKATSAYDTASNNNTGTLANGAAWSPGKSGSGVLLDGVDDCVQIASSTSLDALSTMTFSGWAKTSDVSLTNEQGIFVFNFSGTDRTYVFLDNAAGGITVHNDINDTSSNNLVSNFVPSANQWFHVAWSMDGTTWRLYINGREYANAASSLTIADVDNGYTAGIGTRTRNSCSDTWKGSIDHVRLYNYARTPAQIAWEYNKGAPIAHYKLDECQGTTAYNSVRTGTNTAAGMNGTISIGATGTNTSAGTCTGASTDAWKNGASGKINSSLSFDGSNDYVSVAQNTALVPSEFSVATWIKADTLPSTRGTPSKLVMKQHASSPWLSYEMYIETNDRTYFGIANTNPTPTYYYARSPALSTGTWYHLVGTYSNNTLKMYLNGHLTETTATAGTMFTSTYLLMLGANDANTQLFDGNMDDVQIYNYALTPVQVKDIYNNGAVSFK